MKGRVLFFNVAKGFGFVKPEGSEELLFVHESKIRMGGFRALLPGMSVEFEIGTGPDGRPQAWDVKVPLPDESYCKGFTTGSAKPMNPEKGGIIPLSIQDGQVVVAGADPHVGGIGAGYTFAAYLVGGRVNGFRFELPRYDGTTVYLVLDPAMKEPVIVDTGKYDFAPVGSYLMVLSGDGKVVVYNLGRRHQHDSVQRGDQQVPRDRNWAVVERRFEHRYDLTRPIAYQDTPTTPGLERDNDGFVPSLEVCRQFLS